MGWLWASSDPAQERTSPPPQKGPVNTALNQTERPPPPEPSPATHPAEADLQDLLRSLPSVPSPPTPPPRSKYQTALTSPLPPEPTATSPTDPSSITPITPSLLYPTTISCRAAFDSAFYCQSLGGQFNSVYRSGSLRDCSAHWSAFWFCMRTNRGFLGDEERGKRVREHYWKRDEKYRQGRSSEDVWAARKEVVSKESEEGCFEEDFEAVEKAEAAEMMRRARMRRSLYGGWSDSGG